MNQTTAIELHDTITQQYVHAVVSSASVNLRIDRLP